MKKEIALLVLFVFFIIHNVKAQLPADTIGAGNTLVFVGNYTNYINLGPQYKTQGFPFTVEAWVYVTGYPTLNAGIFAQDNSTAYYGFQLVLNPDGQVYIFFGDGLGFSPANRRGFLTDDPLPLNKWSHIAVVCTSVTNVIFYVDGVLQSEEPDNGYTPDTTFTHSSNGPATIGLAYTQSTYAPFNGLIDEVRFWNDTLSQTQVRQSMCSKINGKTLRLVGYWRCDEADTSTTVKDYSSNGYTGTVEGSVNRLTSDAPLGNNSAYLYTADFTGQSVRCATSNGDSLIASQITGTPSGVQVYSVNSVPFFTEGLNAVPSNYFGVYCVYGTNPAYQVTYHYKLPDGFITVANQDSAIVSTRLEATDTPWTSLNGTLNTAQQTITQTDQDLGRQEYILSLAANTPCNNPNIVNNPSFENHSACPSEENQLNLCDGWSNITRQYYPYFDCGSPDYLSTCGSGRAQLPNCYYGTVQPHGGSCVADYTTYDAGTDYREYIETFFTTPMVVGQTYTVSYYLTTGTNQAYDYHTNNEGVLFSVDSLTNCTSAMTWRNPQYNDTSIFDDSSGWQLFTFEYTPDSAYKYIIFGDFFLDGQSKIEKVHNTGNEYSQIFVDDVSVTSASGNINASVTPANDTICPGASVKLKANGGTTYLWSTLATTDSIIVSPTKDTSYSVVISLGSCVATDTAKIEVNLAPPINIEPQNPIICSYQSILLTVPASGSNYQWSPSAGLSATTGDSVIATPTINVTYTVTGIDSLGCQVSATDAINLIPAPNIPTITVSVTGDSLISSAKSYNQWYFDDVLMPGDTGRYLVIKGHAKGWYSVTVTNPANGCSTTSDSTTAVNELSAISEQLSVYPNPFGNTIFVKISHAVKDLNNWSLELTDVLGQTLFAQASLNYSNEIDLSDLPSGVYFITVADKTDRGVFTVVKQN